MQTKLTLRIDENLIRFGKKWARKRGMSLSRLLGDYLALLRKISHEKDELPPLTRQLLGVARGVDERDYYRHLEEKHR